MLEVTVQWRGTGLFGERQCPVRVAYRELGGKLVKTMKILASLPKPFQVPFSYFFGIPKGRECSQNGGHHTPFFSLPLPLCSQHGQGFGEGPVMED